MWFLRCTDFQSCLTDWSSHDNVLRWMPWDLTDKSTMVQVMAWCHQAISHHLSQCWPRFISPYSITRPHNVFKTWYRHKRSLWLPACGCHSIRVQTCQICAIFGNEFWNSPGITSLVILNICKHVYQTSGYEYILTFNHIKNHSQPNVKIR